ncbi:MAG: DUF721 domain-containing protein [Lentisphaerae bacterium]|jgi:hypothetical protein|nr:DUF721 domain-containing protein [Lentisphaerota bacterium]
MSGGDAKKSSEKTWLKREQSGSRRGFFRRPTKHESEREGVLADWLGEERSSSVMADLREMHTDMEGMLREILSKVEPNDVILLTRIQENWESLVGADNARMCSADRLQDGILSIRLHHSTLRFVFERELKGKLEEVLKAFTSGEVKKIRFV